MESLRNIITRIEQTPVTVGGWIIGFFLIVFLRTFIEPFSNILAEGVHFGVWSAFFVQPLWFFAAFLFLFIALHWATKEDIRKVSIFSTIVILPVLFIPPLVDIILSGPQSVYYTYISGSYTEMLILFATMLLAAGGAVSFGMKLAAAALLILSGVYIYAKTESIKRVLVGVLVIYTGFFLFAGVSFHVFAAYNTISGSNKPVSAQSEYAFYFENQDKANTVTYMQEYPVLQTEVAGKSFFVIVSSALATIALFLAVWWYAIYSREKLRSTMRNIPLLRAVLFYTLIGCGVALGIATTATPALETPMGIFAFWSFLASFLFAGMYVAWTNDETDIDIDRVSNSSRPLVSGTFSPSEWSTLKYVFLFISLAFGIIAGYYAFLYILAFIALYYIYSAYPFRLKRIPILSSAVVSAATVVTLWGGFFVATGESNLFAFPHHVSIGVFLFFFLFESFKNIKDMEGDRAGGITTIPNMNKDGVFFTALLAAAAPVLFSIIVLPHLVFIAISILFAAVFYTVITREPYRERYVFYVLYAFILAAIVAYLLIG